MRIIAGKYKSRLIQMPKAVKVRPTQDRVREAVFNILGKACAGAKVLDLYSGSGAFGIEALSRGADRVTFVDTDSRCIRTIKENLKSLNILHKMNVIKSDAIRAMGRLASSEESFDLVFLDPPYYKGLTEKTLITINKYDIIRPSGIIVAEHSKKDEVPESVGRFRLVRQSTYGDTVISFYKSK